MSRLIYFSFVTMTTVGYGDITPQSVAAGNLAILQALTGQIYLVVILARLVSLAVATADRE
jgi:voltage-gated potassium channel Kch